MRNQKLDKLIMRKPVKKVFLTIDQIEFLIKNFDHLEDLANGRKAAQNETDRRFVRVVKAKGWMKPGTSLTKQENAYLYMKEHNLSIDILKRDLEKKKANVSENNENLERYQKIDPTTSGLSLSEQASLRHPHIAKGASKKTNSAAKNVKIDYSQIPGSGLVPEQKYTPHKLAEPLGTREDYKKDRASYRRR